MALKPLSCLPRRKATKRPRFDVLYKINVTSFEVAFHCLCHSIKGSGDPLRSFNTLVFKDVLAQLLNKRSKKLFLAPPASL